MAKFVISFLLAVIVSTASDAITLSEALEKTRTHNALLTSSAEDITQQIATEKQAKSDFLPTVTVSGSLYDGTTKRGSLEEHTSSEALQLEVRQNLFNGGTIYYGAAAAAATTAATTATYHDLIQQALTATVDAYIDVLVAAHIVDLQRAQVTLLTEQYRATLIRFDQNDVTMTDVKQAEARLAAAKAEYVQAEGDMKIANATYSVRYGEPLENGTWPEDLPTFPENLMKTYTNIIENHPELTAAQETLSASRKTHLSNRGAYFPELDLVAQHRRSEDDNSFIPSITDSRVGLEVTWSLYEGGRDRQERVKSAAAITAAKQDVTEVRRQLTQIFRSAYARLTTAESVQQARITEEGAAKIARDGVQKEYLLGSRTLLDLLDAEQELLSSRVNFITAKGDVIKARYALKSALGELY